MRILHVIDSLGGSGGAEHGLVREITLFSSDTEQMVCRLFSKNHLEPLLEKAEIPVIGLDLSAAAAAYGWPVAVARLTKLVRRYRPDVIHSSLFTGNLVAQLTGSLTRTPVLSTFTLSGDPDLLRSYQPGAASRRAAVLRRIAAQGARGKRVWFRSITHDALVTNCRLLGVAPERVVVIPRGVPPSSSARPANRVDLGLPANGRLIMNIGRQSAQKGHIYLLRALKQLRNDIDAHLVIAGREGDASATIHATIEELALQPHVTLTGYSSEVSDFLRISDVFAFPSLMEGLGTSVLEAMEAGVPVVAFDIPPIREITDNGRAGVLVPVGDVAGLVEGIREMSDVESAERYTTAAKQLIRERHDLPLVAHRLEQLLRQVALG